VTTRTSQCCSGTAEATLTVEQCHCQIMLTMALPSRCWPWRDDAVEPWWQWCRRVNVDRVVMSLPSHASDGNGAVKSMLTVA
jgi:hypothetical protein